MWERSVRHALVWAAFAALSLFYVIPVAAVQSLLALNSVTGWLASVPVRGGGGRGWGQCGWRGGMQPPCRPCRGAHPGAAMPPHLPHVCLSCFPPHEPAQVVNALVTAILPGLALKIFVKLLPGLLALMARHGGGCKRPCVAKAASDRGAVPLQSAATCALGRGPGLVPLSYPKKEPIQAAHARCW